MALPELPVYVAPNTQVQGDEDVLPVYQTQRGKKPHTLEDDRLGAPVLPVPDHPIVVREA